MDEVILGLDKDRNIILTDEFNALSETEQAHIMHSAICYGASFFSKRDVDMVSGLVYVTDNKSYQPLFLISSEEDCEMLKKTLTEMLDLLTIIILSQSPTLVTYCRLARAGSSDISLEDIPKAA